MDLISERDGWQCWRVTKYDPAHRSQPDAYADEWCDFSDVGGAFAGEVLTLDAYEQVERQYLNALRAFALESGHSALQLTRVQDDEQREGAVVDLDAAEAIARRVLRGETWCDFQSAEGDFYVHFGYDYYMYIGSHSRCPEAIARATAGGLFVEPDVPSPHL